MRAGGAGDERGAGVAVDATGAATVTGYFYGSATFGSGAQTVALLSTSGYDMFVARYNPDGTLAWAKKAGGTSNDFGRGVAVDATGAATITGDFAGSATFGSGAEAVTLTSSGNGDVFVARYNPDGTLAWAKKAGGTSWDYGQGVAVDATGAATITGYFGGSATFGSATQAVTLSSTSGYEMFVARYNPDGTLAWAKKAGGTSNDYGYGVAVDATGAATVTGYFYGSATFGSGAQAVTLSSAGGQDVFVARYNPDGTLSWAQQSYGTGGGYGYGVAVDATGAATVTGSFSGSSRFGSGAQTVTLTSGGGYDMFVARYNPDGTLAWAKKAGGTNGDIGQGVAVDADGAATITGSFEISATFESDARAVTLTSAGNEDMFVTRYKPDGTLAWATRAGGTSWEYVSGVAVDATGAATITGAFSGSATFGPGAQALTLTSAGNDDAFVARYNTDEPVLVTPAAVTFTDVCGTTNDTYTIPTSEGVEYRVAGQVKPAGTHPATNSVTVTANATTGYLLAEDAADTWNQTFDTTACPVQVTPATVTFTDECGTTNDTYTIPATEGVEYRVGDQVKPAGTHPATNSVTVTANATTGYLLAEDATDNWNRTFDTTACPVEVTPAFLDVTPTTQFYKEITWLADQGVSTGWQVAGGAEYRPVTPVNRDAMAAFMYRLAGSPTWEPPAQSPFLDVTPTTQFYKEITWLADQGISTGWQVAGGTEYRPVTPVNRDAMAAFMYRLAGSPTWEPPAQSPFLDVTPTTQFYKEITWLADQGISTGWEVAGGAEYRPVTPVNRDAMAAFMYRLKVEKRLV